MPRINHFIVLMLENRSFDRLFGFFPPPAGETIENLLALHSVNVQLTNNSRGPSDTVPIQNSGFARNYADNLKPRLRVVDREHVEQVMQCFSPDQLPALNQLARDFCLCDHWHREVPGPTMPNRMFMRAATSEGCVHNDFKRLTRDWALGMLSLLSGGLESVEETPATQGEAKLEAAGL